jgi:hypothetical protein
MAQALICYNVLSNYILAAKIDKMEKVEKKMLRFLLPEIRTTNSLCRAAEKQDYCNVINKITLI